MRERLFDLAKKLDGRRSKASDVIAKELRRAAEKDPDWVLEELVDELHA